MSRLGAASLRLAPAAAPGEGARVALPEEEPRDSRFVGRVLEKRYRLDRLVGRGGFGVVFEGRHLTLGVPIAVKLLHITPEVVGAERHADVLASFMEEAKIVARLRHPSIVTVLDCGIAGEADFSAPAPSEGTNASGGGASDADDANGANADGGGAGTPKPRWPVPWIVMEWCDGTGLDVDLEARRGRGGRTVAATWSLLRPIVEAIAHAHKNGVIHRDVKPSNVMLTGPVGGRATARLLDFGIAKYVDPDDVAGSGVTATTSTWRPFTPAYAAIEQRIGGRTGPWTDVYSLALLFVEALTDTPPTQGHEPGQLSVAPERRTPAAFGVDVGGWESVLRKALSVRPSERHANAGELLAALEAALPPAAARGATSDPGDVLVAAGIDRRTAWAEAETLPAPTLPDPSIRPSAPGALPMDSVSPTRAPDSMSPTRPGDAGRKAAVRAGGLALAAALVLGAAGWAVAHFFEGRGAAGLGVLPGTAPSVPPPAATASGATVSARSTAAPPP